MSDTTDARIPFCTRSWNYFDHIHILGVEYVVKMEMNGECLAVAYFEVSTYAGEDEETR